jgi:hypothetical protein
MMQRQHYPADLTEQEWHLLESYVQLDDVISKDYEYLLETREATLLLAMIRTLVKRLANKLVEF